MYNKAIISQALYGIVGLRQPFDTENAILETRNTTSRSDLYITDNAYVKVPYLKATQDNAEITDANFNDLLENMQKSSIQKVMSAVFSQSDYIDRNVLYRYAGQKVETDVLPFGFVGYKIQVCEEKNIAFEISRVMLDFEGTGAIELMLFNTGKKTPLFIKEIDITTDHQSEQLDWKVDNSGDTYKGDYYLGYISTGISVQPYKRNYQRSIEMSSYTYLDIDKICVPGHAGNQLFDVRTVGFMNEDTGLNPDITVYEDFTDLIIQNESLFATAIYYEFIIAAIQIYAATTRSNRLERLTEQFICRAVMEVEGSGSDGLIKGIRPVLKSEMVQLAKEVKNLKEGYFGTSITVYTAK